MKLGGAVKIPEMWQMSKVRSLSLPPAKHFAAPGWKELPGWWKVLGGDQRNLSHPRFLAALGNLGITTCWYLEKHQITLNAMNQFWVSRQQKYLCVCPNCLFYCLVSPFKAKKKISDNLKYMSARKPLVIFIVNTAAVKTACLYYEEGEWNIRSHQHLSSCSFLLLFCLKGEKTLF